MADLTSMPDKEEVDRAVAAAKVSESIYGTPAYGMIIATICPPAYWWGRSKCMLPKFDVEASEVKVGYQSGFYRVPLFGEVVE